MSFSGLKDVDREILKWIDNTELLKICSVNRKTWHDVCDVNFLRKRLNIYTNIDQYKNKNESWKEFFSRTIYYISKLKTEFQFEYTEGNFQEYYSVLKNYKRYQLIRKASEIGALPLVKYAIQSGVIFDVLYLELAAKAGHLHIVKYCAENVPNIQTWEESLLIQASWSGYLNIIKYLVERGVDIHVLNDTPLREASRWGFLDVVKYLVEHGAD